jgi:hypothetical protein
MAAAKSITPETLVALGAPALAAALIEHAENDPILRKKLRMLLAGTEGPGKLAAELGKRIQTIGRSRSFVDWDKRKPLVQELDHIRTTIGTTLATQSPAAAIERLWDFIGIADRVLERVGDGIGEVEDIFGEAMVDLGRLIAADPNRDTNSLARRVLAMSDGDGFGSYGGTIRYFSEALGPGGRAVLRRATEKALSALPPPKHEDGWRDGNQRWPLAQRLMALADLEHDADAYIAAVRAGGSEDRHASDIAKRLIDAKRPAEALQWLDKPRRRGDEVDNTDVDLRIAALVALGRKDDVQALRWATFERVLSIEHLRAYLKALPDFEDFDAEQKALAIASSHKLADLALEFLVGWPALDRAASLVRDRITDLDGRAYERLRPAAQALEERFPDAATLLYRHLVESVLDRASSKQYPYAARDLISAIRVVARVPPGAAIESDTTYLARLRKQHGRKYGFWHLIDQTGR